MGVLLWLALGAPLTADAQQGRKRYRIGTLTAAWAANHPAVDGLRAGLAALGMHEGREVEFEHRYVEGRLKELPAAAESLIANHIDLLFTEQENATQAALKASTKVPIVFANVGDPVASGFVRALSHPGRNVTGVSNVATELAPKRLEMLKALAPELRRVRVIYDADGGSAVLRAAQRIRAAAPALGVELFDQPVRTPKELTAALAAVRRGDGLLPIENGGSALNIAAQMIDAAARIKALTMFSSAFWLEHGALAAYGTDHRAVGYQAARLVAKILAGTRPEDVPVEGANRIELVINLKVAKAIGISIPQTMLIRAERVIE
jgi:putative ABC transport system substrate-binding protein